MQRQNDGILHPFPIWDDVRTFDGRPWRGRVDVVSGGFPCQDISIAGRGAGIGGERSGLWREMARIIREVGPRCVLVENSPILTSRGLGTVLGDLATMGYDAEWGVLGAVHAGAPHKRERIWIVAHANGVWELQSKRGVGEIWRWSGNCGCEVGNANGKGLEKRQSVPGHDGAELPASFGTNWWESEPRVGRVAHGVASRVDRLKALGNGQVPAVVALAKRLIG